MPTHNNRKASCGKCSGTGKIDKVQRGQCPKCRGNDKKCRRCGGSGTTTIIIKINCTSCRGKGFVYY